MIKRGLLLVNLGSPDSPKHHDVRHYLAQFLNDPRVITLPRWLRLLLIYTIILPFRAQRSVKAYEKIWTTQGSPLCFHTQSLAQALQHKLQNNYIVSFAMRYGQPTIEQALQALSACDHLTILPLYPQYASASTGSALEKTLQIIKQQPTIPSLNIIHAFYHHPAFIDAQASLIRPYLNEQDWILFSYHGLPSHQLKSAGCSQPCEAGCAFKTDSTCYRAQCYATSQLLAEALKLPHDKYATSFQSRFGYTPWIQPYTDEFLISLRQRGIKKLLISCPSFTADCLETLEEIGIKARDQWLSLGGDSFTLVPALNASDQWVQAVMAISGCH